MMLTDLSTTGRATEPRRSAVGVLILTVAVLFFGFAGSVSATVPNPTGTDPSDTTAPPTTEAPDDTLPDDTLVPGDETVQEEDEGLDVAPVAIVGFLVLLTIASWWMLRRDDVDDQPSPVPGEPEWRADQVAP